MKLVSIARSTAGSVALLAGVAALPLAAGLAHVATVSADNPAYPIRDPYRDAPIGIVQVATTPTGDQLTIDLSAGLANTVYTVSLCSTDSTGVLACAAPAANGSLAVDGGGNGETMVTVADASTLDEVTLTDPAGHVYTADFTNISGDPSRRAHEWRKH